MNITFNELKKFITKARNIARDDVKKSYPVLMSRGAWLRARNPEADEPLNFQEEDFASTKKEVLDFVSDWELKGATEISIEGDFDGGNSPHDWKYGDYTTLISDWDITIWTKESGWLSAESIAEEIETSRKA